MATLRADEPEDISAPANADVIVPVELVLGACTQVWGDTGHQFDLGSAFGNHSRAKMDWQREEGLTVAQLCALVPSSSPWSLQVPDWQRESGPPSPEPDERLAKHGLTEADIPALRRAAQARITDTDKTTRRTP